MPDASAGSPDPGAPRPTLALPVAIAIVVGGLIFAARQNREWVENPLVEFSILTVGVFAFAAAFRWIATKAQWPGMAIFFGGTPAPRS